MKGAAAVCAAAATGALIGMFALVSVVSASAGLVNNERGPGPSARQPEQIDVEAVAGEIPVRAARAYAAAAEHPLNTCGVTWNWLAGIGERETAHGTYPAGHSIHPVTGHMTPRFLMWDNIDTGGGPMAFLIGTWAKWGRDGDGDGIADIQDVDDATVAAAALLCATGWEAGDRRSQLGAAGQYNGGMRCFMIASCRRYVADVSRVADRWAGTTLALQPEPGGGDPTTTTTTS